MNYKGIAAAILLAIFLVAGVAAQSSGTFTMTQSVIAGGGVQGATGGTFSLDSTTVQSVAGNAMGGSPFTVTSGFWNPTPTASTVSVSGRVRAATGRGI